MLATRVIPTMLLKQSGFYKGKRFKDHSYIGDPVNTIKIFNEKEVDELVILDISATRERRKPDFPTLTDIASEAFIPLAYGGGIRSLEDADRIFSIGFEKIVVNTPLFELPEFIESAAAKYGSQSVVASVDYRTPLLGSPTVFSHAGTRNQRIDPVAAAMRAVELGAGEIMLTCIDRDGTFSGYDLRTLKAVCAAVDVPTIASGGASSIDDFLLAKHAGASAVAAGAMFVYHGPHRAVLIQYPSYERLATALGHDIPDSDQESSE